MFCKQNFLYISSFQFDRTNSPKGSGGQDRGGARGSHLDDSKLVAGSSRADMPDMLPSSKNKTKSISPTRQKSAISLKKNEPCFFIS